MKKIFALGSCLVSLSALNAYALTATPLAPVGFTSAIPNAQPIFFGQDPKHFLVYTKGEITLVDAIKNSVAGNIPKPNLYENLEVLFALQNGKLLALDATGLYISKDRGQHWDKTAENLFGRSAGIYPIRFLQNKVLPQNLFVITADKIFVSHDEGHTWKTLWQEETININCHPFDILQMTDGNIYIVTHRGKMQVTQDEGQNWQELSNTVIPPQAVSWHEKAFCSLGAVEKGYFRLGNHIFEIKSPQLVKLAYVGPGDSYEHDCFVDNQQNLYASSVKDKKTSIVSLDQDYKSTLINTFTGKIYNITQDSEGKNYLNTSLGLAITQTLNDSIVPYPAIFKQGVINELSVNNETDFVTTVGYDNWSDPFDAYLSQDGGANYTHFDKKYYKLFYFKGALTYLARCDAGRCLNTSKDNGKTWQLVELPKEIEHIFGIEQDRGILIIEASQGFFFSSDLENWNAIVTSDVYKSKNLAAILKKHKPLSIPMLKEKQNIKPKKVKSLKAFNAPNTSCEVFQLAVNISPSNTFTLLQHGCRFDDDIYLSKDEGAHWERANSNLPSSVLDSPLYVPLNFLENGHLVLLDHMGGTLQKSTDGGVHFKNIIQRLPPMGLGGASLFTHSGNSLFALGSLSGGGVYFSRDAGKTWERLNIINSETFDLQLVNNKLFLATEEDGIFSAKF